MKPNRGITSSDFWMEQYKEDHRGRDLLEEKLLAYKGSRAGDAIELALKKIDREQEDKQKNTSDSLDTKMLRLSQRTLDWTAFGVLVACVGLYLNFN